MEGTWCSAEDITNVPRTHSTRIFRKLLVNIDKVILDEGKRCLLSPQTSEDVLPFPEVQVRPAVGEFREGQKMLLSFSTSQLSTFHSISKKALYQLCVKVRNIQALSIVKESRWCEFLASVSSPKRSRRSLYKHPIQ